MTGEQYLKDITACFSDYRQKAERAMAQISDASFFEKIDAEANSVAELVKHLAGNLKSRWQDVLTTDGEKPDRHRDTEFRITPEDTRAALTDRWEAGWNVLETSLRSFVGGDLGKTITIRQEPLTLFSALHRSLAHAAEHVGQIILLAKHYSGPGWQTLSIARGKSEEFNRAMREGK